MRFCATLIGDAYPKTFRQHLVSFLWHTLSFSMMSAVLYPAQSVDKKKCLSIHWKPKCVQFFYTHNLLKDLDEVIILYLSYFRTLESTLVRYVTCYSNKINTIFYVKYLYSFILKTRIKTLLGRFKQENLVIYSITSTGSLQVDIKPIIFSLAVILLLYI